MSSNNNTANSTATVPASPEEVHKHIEALNSLESRELALYELCKQREVFPDLAVLLWHSCGTVAALLQEITAVYPYIQPTDLTAHQSNRVCNALALLQCLASHPDTRTEFLHANIPYYLYVFLNNTSPERPFEYLRLTSLGVIGALVKTDEQEVIEFLLNSEFIPLCLVIMENGTELCKKVATFIMHKLLSNESGLRYICHTYERFAHVNSVLNKVVTQLATEKSAALLRYVIICFVRLTEDQRALDALRNCLPSQLTDGTFVDVLEQDAVAKRYLSQLMRTINANPATASADAAGAFANAANSNNNNVAISGDQSAESGSNQQHHNTDVADGEDGSANQSGGENKSGASIASRS